MMRPMRNKVEDRLVWLDMEMTGLDPETCVPIEVGVIITEGNLEDVEGANYEAVIHQPESAFEGMADIVVKMHTENGLLDRVRQSPKSIEEVDAELAAVIEKHCVPTRAMLAGNTIQQDRLFIRKYMPKTEATLHYRQVDVSTLKELVRRWYGGKSIFAKQTSHTAMSDIRNSIAELQYYRSRFLIQGA